MEQRRIKLVVRIDQVDDHERVLLRRREDVSIPALVGTREVVEVGARLLIGGELLEVDLLLKELGV